MIFDSQNSRENRYNNHLVRENAFERIEGCCLLRVIGSYFHLLYLTCWVPLKAVTEYPIRLPW